MDVCFSNPSHKMPKTEKAVRLLSQELADNIISKNLHPRIIFQLFVHYLGKYYLLEAIYSGNGRINKLFLASFAELDEDISVDKFVRFQEPKEISLEGQGELYLAQLKQFTLYSNTYCFAIRDHGDTRVTDNYVVSINRLLQFKPDKTYNRIENSKYRIIEYLEESLLNNKC